MIKVEVEFTSKVVIELPVKNYQEIMVHHMSIEESDKLVQKVLFDKYSITADEIITVDPID